MPVLVTAASIVAPAGNVVLVEMGRASVRIREGRPDLGASSMTPVRVFAMIEDTVDPASGAHRHGNLPASMAPERLPAAIEARIAADPYGAWIGIELLEVRPGYCRAALTLTSRMVNFHGSPHGGAIFSLADFAFAGACNAHGEPAVALTVTIQFHAAPQVGRRLVAEARETRQGRSAGFYAMTVTDEADGSLVATCQAVSLRTRVTGPQ
jgi:acyl-CoA thioesterase